MAEIDWSEHDVIVTFNLKNDRIGQRWKGNGPYYLTKCRGEHCWWEDEFFEDPISIQTLIEAKNEHDEFARNNV